MKCVVCGQEAVYTYHGDTFCNEHFNEQTENKYSARQVYLLGIIFWLLLWIVFIYGALNKYLQLNMFVRPDSWWIFALFSIIGCVIGLSFNLKMWWNPRSFACYETEVRVIEFVERNVGPLITANSIVLSITFLSYVQLLKSFPPISFIVYEILSLAFASLVLPLYWIPADHPKDLVKLRHIKTLFYFYSVFFFFAALIALVLYVYDNTTIRT